MATKINKNKVIAAAQKCVQKGQFDKAIKEYTKIVEEDPRDVRIWLKIGDLHAKKNDKKEAVDTYSKVAEFYSEQGFYLKAVAVYKQILKIDNALVEVNLRLAELYKQLGLLSDAMQQYEQVSNFYHRSGRTKEALAALRQIVDLDPENVASRIKLAELYSKENMREEAVEEFSKAADFLRADNRIDDFVKVAERLVFHHPENMGITRELASIYLSKRDPRRALQKLQLAFKADPRDEQTLEMLAQAFENLGQVAKTVSVLKELANIHAENGQDAKQREIYQRIMTISPSDEDAQKALEQPQPYQGDDYAGAQFDQEGVDPNANAGAEAYGYEQDYGGEPGYTGEPDYTGEQYPKDAGQPHPEGYEPPANLEGPDAGYDEAGYEPTDAYAHQPDYQQAQGQHYEAPEHLEEVNSQDYEIVDELEAPPRANYAAADFEAEVAKIITEADVYVKYGLQDKAVEHLMQVFDRDPGNLDVHIKLKELYVQMGRYKEAALELVILGQMYQEADPRQSAAYLNEALELDPDNSEARGILNGLEGSDVIEVEGPSGEYEDYDDVEAIDLDAADIVEEIPIDSSDLLDASELTPVNEGELRGYATEPGGDVGSLGQDLGDWDDDEDFTETGLTTESGITTHPEHSPNKGSGVIEIHGETTDTLGGGTPNSELIELGSKPQVLDSQVRIRQEEEATRIEDDLEEAEFFIQQNLLSEARAILDEVSGRSPNNPLVVSKMQELEAAERRIGAGGAEPLIEEPTASLADELAPEFNDAAQQQASQANSDYSVEDVFEEFKRGGESQASEEDSDTHYDLGIAYREMGLLDDAITEFKVAMRSRDKEVLCHMMIGLCYIEKEMLSESISQFKTGLYVEGITDRETIALYFELGQAYERLEDLREALYYYEKVAKKDPTFRSVGAKIEQLEAQGVGESIRVDSNDDGTPGQTASNTTPH